MDATLDSTNQLALAQSVANQKFSTISGVVEPFQLPNWTLY
jgi:hypothetical protein